MPQQLKTCRRVTADDEFYTHYRDVVRGLHNFDLRWRRIVCPCDTRRSNIYLYLKDILCDVECDSRGWERMDYSRYELVVTNPPFSQVRRMLRHLAGRVDFLLIVSDVLRLSIERGGFRLPVPVWVGRDVQKFLRPDGSEKAVHCRWISSFPDTLGRSYKIPPRTT